MSYEFQFEETRTKALPPPEECGGPQRKASFVASKITEGAVIETLRNCVGTAHPRGASRASAQHGKRRPSWSLRRCRLPLFHPESTRAITHGTAVSVVLRVDGSVHWSRGAHRNRYLSMRGGGDRYRSATAIVGHRHRWPPSQPRARPIARARVQSPQPTPLRHLRRVKPQQAEAWTGGCRFRNLVFEERRARCAMGGRLVSAHVVGTKCGGQGKGSCSVLQARARMVQCHNDLTKT